MNFLNPVSVHKKTHEAVKRRSCLKPVLDSHLDLLREGTFSDVTFIVGPSKEKIPCHQLFLKSRSSVLQAMFSERWDHDKSQEIVMEDVDPQIFRKFLQFIYSDTFVADVSEALELLQIAHKYDVQLLASKCMALVKSDVTLDDAVDVFQAARKYVNAPLMDKVGGLMAKCLPKLQSLPSFSRADEQTLMYILKRNDLNMEEVDLFRLAVQWAKSQSGLNVHQRLQNILLLIRFPIMTLEQFTTTVVPTGLLSQPTLIELFTYFGTDAETKKSMANALKFSTQLRVVINQVGLLPDVPYAPLPEERSKLSSELLLKNSVRLHRDKPVAQPKSKDSIVSFSLNSGDLENAVTERDNFLQLKESLRFSMHYDCLQTQLSFEGGVMKQRTAVNNGGIGLNGVSFYCPATITGHGMVSSPFRKFKVLAESLDTRYAGQAFKELLRLSPVTAPEGKVTEAKFDTVIPLADGMDYRITLEEINSNISPKGNVITEINKDKYWGTLPSSAIVNVGDTRFFLKNMERESWGHTDSQPQLNLKMSFKEMDEVIECPTTVWLSSKYPAIAPASSVPHQGILTINPKPDKVRRQRQLVPA